MKILRFPLGIPFAFLLGLAPLLAPAQDSPLPKPEFFKGNVVPLTDALTRVGIKVDGDAGLSMALVAPDGKIYPLVKDAGSRMFFQDPQLLNRPMRLTARLVGNSQILQVVNVHSYKNGLLHDVYYWCDICTIRGYQKTICDCCGDPMEFREEPSRDK